MPSEDSDCDTERIGWRSGGCFCHRRPARRAAQHAADHHSRDSQAPCSARSGVARAPEALNSPLNGKEKDWIFGKPVNLGLISHHHHHQFPMFSHITPYFPITSTCLKSSEAEKDPVHSDLHRDHRPGRLWNSSMVRL